MLVPSSWSVVVPPWEGELLEDRSYYLPFFVSAVLSLDAGIQEVLNKCVMADPTKQPLSLRETSPCPPQQEPGGVNMEKTNP